MLDEKELQSHLISMEAAAMLILDEAKKIREMIEVKEKPVKLDMTAINFYKRRLRSMERAAEKSRPAKE